MPITLLPSGHLPDGSGVQRHSAGATYPYIVVATNRGAHVQAPDGQTIVNHLWGDNPTRADRLACYGAAIDAAVGLARSLAIARARRAAQASTFANLYAQAAACR